MKNKIEDLNNNLLSAMERFSDADLSAEDVEKLKLSSVRFAADHRVAVAKESIPALEGLSG